MRYAIARFRREIPNIGGMRLVASFDMYQIFEFATDEAWDNFPSNVPREEITEFQGTVSWRFYGEVRGYRSAYSDVEGLEPDPDELAKGKRKTKIYMTEEITNETISLMKKIFKRNIIDEFDTRSDRTGEQELLDFVDSLTTIKEISYHKERLFGTEMSKTQLRELYLWDDPRDSRKGRHHFLLGF